MRKYIIVALITVFLAGCTESKQNPKAFDVQDLKPGMTKSEVQAICNGHLVMVSLDGDPYGNNTTVYRMWPNKVEFAGQNIAGSPMGNLLSGGKDTNPYLLVFVNDKFTSLYEDTDTLNARTLQQQRNWDNMVNRCSQPNPQPPVIMSQSKNDDETYIDRWHKEQVEKEYWDEYRRNIKYKH
jgi:hypothetical protein